MYISNGAIIVKISIISKSIPIQIHKFPRFSSLPLTTINCTKSK